MRCDGPCRAWRRLARANSIRADHDHCPCVISSLVAESRTETPQTRKNARAHRAGRRSHRNEKRLPNTFQKAQTPNFLDHYWLLVALRGGALRFRVIAVFRVIPEHPTGLADDDATTTTRTTKPASYAVRPRASRPARAPCVRWAWRGRDPRRGSRRVRVVCYTERRRDKFKQQRRGGVMVCVSVFVTHQEARGCF